MLPAQDIRLICFDLGRVLVRICDDWQHAARCANIQTSLRTLTDTQNAEIVKLIHAVDTGVSNSDAFCSATARVFEIDPSCVRKMQDHYIRGTYPGAAELLNELHDGGYATACLSNTNDNHWRIMFESDNADYASIQHLGQRFASHLIGHRKPDAPIYEHFEKATGLQPAQIVFFDDLPDNIAAASARGWRVFQIADDGDPIRQMRRHLATLGVLKE